MGGMFCIALMESDLTDSTIELAASETKTVFDWALETTGTISDVRLGGKAAKLYSCTPSHEGTKSDMRVYVFECKGGILMLMVVCLPGSSEMREKIIESFEFFEDF